MEAEEEEEVELWNDEDGLVVDEDFDALDSHLPPANKRQRTASPPSSTTTTTPTSHGTADPTRKVQLVNNAQHLIGSEVKQAPSIINAFLHIISYIAHKSNTQLLLLFPT